jgi:cation diffusion facilitator family transporter
MPQATAPELTDAQRRTTLASIVAASFLVAIKLGVGVAAGSIALISAGIESSGDVVAATLTFFAVRLGHRPADPEHPFGHARAENLGALGEAAILLAGGLIVGVSAIKRLVEPDGIPETRWYVFAVIGVALAIDLARTVVSLRTARRYGSPALRSNAFHFASDMAGSVAVLVGLILVRAGVAQGDAAAALVIAAIILVAAVRLLVDNANVLMDRTPAEARDAAERALARLEPEIELARLRLRESAGRYFADVIVAVPPGAAVVEGHQAADLVEQAIQRVLPGSDVVVHVEPRRGDLDLRDRILEVALREPLVREVHDIRLYEQAGAVSVSLHLKFPADVRLQEALEVAGRIERVVREHPSVSDVQSHLEPLERPLVVRSSDTDAASARVSAIERVVVERTGRRPSRIRVLDTEAGAIVFLTVSVTAATTLPEAHRLSSDLEDDLRRRISDVADFVIHTEIRAD